MQPENNRRTTRVGDVTKKRSSKPSLIMVTIKCRFLFISYWARIKIGRNLSGDPGMDAGPQHGHTRRAEGCSWGKLQKCPPDRAVITGAVPRSRARYCFAGQLGSASFANGHSLLIIRPAEGHGATKGL